MSFRRYILFAVMVLVAAMALRTGVAYWWQGRMERSGERFSMGDSDSYWVLGQRIAAGEPYQYYGFDSSVFRSPGYPWLLSWLVDPTNKSHGILAARIWGCVFGTIAVAICMAIALALFGRGASILCGIIAALYPGGITMSVLVLSEAPFMPLMMVILALLSRAIIVPQQAYRWTILAGLLSGLAILIRPSWLLFMPFYYLIRLLVARRDLAGRWLEFKLAVTAGAAIAIVMLPWWIRNYQITGHFVITTLQTGPSLYDGLHPGATGGSDSGMAFSSEFATRQYAEDAAAEIKPEDNFEYRLNQRMTTAAVAFAKENPGEVAVLGLKKFYRTWWPLPSVSEIPGGWPTRFIFAVGMLGIMIPALGFILSKSQSNKGLLPFILPAVYYTILHTIFVGSIRYRQPAVFALAVLAAPQLLAWVSRFLPQIERTPGDLHTHFPRKTSKAIER